MKLPWTKTKTVSEPNASSPTFDSFFLALITSLTDGVIVYNPNFQINFVNGPAEKIIGLAANECLNQTISPDLVKNPKFKIITQIIFPTLAPTITRVSENDWPEIIDIMFDEPQLKLRVTTIKINAAAGPVFVKIIRDQTREESILASKKEFLEVSAHQLRTPLTALSWAFETLGKELQSNPNLKNIVDEGLITSKKLLKTVNDLLNAARIEGGKFGYKFEPTDIIKTITDIVSQAKIVAAQSNIKLFFETAIGSLIIPIDV